MKKTLFLCLLFFMSASCFAAEPVSYNGWMEYAVIIQPTGSYEKDLKLLEATREGIANTAKSLLGTPYVWAGESRNGYDCSGFMKSVYARFGIQLPRVSIDQGRAGAPVRPDISALKTGDLIYFRTEKKYPHHVGMYLGNGNFIHAAGGRGVVIDSFYTSPLRESVRSISRIVFTAGQIRELNQKIMAQSAR